MNANVLVTRKLRSFIAITCLLLSIASLSVPRATGQTVGDFDLVATAESVAPGTAGGFGGQVEADEGWFVVRGSTVGLPAGRQLLQVHRSSDGSLQRTIEVNQGDSFYPSNWPTESFAIDSGRVLVGAFWQLAALNPGRVFPPSTELFDINTGVLLQEFDAPADAIGFGFATAMEGNLALVSDPIRERVHIYDATTGLELTTLAPADPTPHGYPSFGQDVAISEGRIAVSDQVRNCVFLYDSQTFAEIGVITAPGSPTGAWFGSSIDLEGDRLAVGALTRGSFDESSGQAFLYDLGAGTSLELVDDHPDYRGVSGFDVEIDDDFIAVGASHRDGAFRSGLVFVFDAHSGDFMGSVPKPPMGLATQWGWYVAADEGRVIVGEPRASYFKDGQFYSEAGRVFVYRVPEPSSVAVALSALMTVGMLGGGRQKGASRSKHCPGSCWKWVAGSGAVRSGRLG
jgi:hypothetical protein